MTFPLSPEDAIFAQYMLPQQITVHTRHPFLPWLLLILTSVIFPHANPLDMQILTLLSSLTPHKCADDLHLVVWTPATQSIYLASALGTKAEVLVATFVAIQAILFAVL